MAQYVVPSRSISYKNQWYFIILFSNNAQKYFLNDNTIYIDGMTKIYEIYDAGTIICVVHAAHIKRNTCFLI